MEILSENKNGLGWITLNRPQALNALSLNMIQHLSQLLTTWEKASSPKIILIQGAGEKAFCAGGDVRYLYFAMKSGDFQACQNYFQEEYALNAQIYTYSKPFVALLDGITMGGGMGISVTGSYRIVTERALLAMPETGIGLFPDAGGTTFLNNTPGHTGLYLGLTGYRMTAWDALWAGLATHFIPSSDLPSFKIDLSKGMAFDEALSFHCQKPREQGYLEKHHPDIETHFSQPTLKEIFLSLAQDSSPFAQTTYQTLQTKSPTSLAVTFRQLKKVGPPLSFEERMKMELRLSQHFVLSHDFKEGIRAVLIDKDYSPRWAPAILDDLNKQDIDSFFS